MAFETGCRSFQSLFTHGLKIHAQKKRKVRLWLPLLIMVILALLSLLFSRVLQKREHDQILRLTKDAGTHITRELESELTARIQAIERISERWGMNGVPTKNSWDAEAKLYVRHYAGIQAVTWVDPNFRIRWVIPYQYNQHLLEAPAPSGDLENLLRTARDRNRPMITKALDLQRGGKGFYVYAPIFTARAHEFHGYTGGVFRAEKIFKIILANVATDYSIVISDGNNRPLFSRDNGNPPGGSEDRRWGLRTVVSMMGANWHIHIWPSRKLVTTNLSLLPLFVLLGGMALAGLVGGNVFLLEQTRYRAFRISRTNLALTQQMKRRRAAETALRETSSRLRLALEASGMGTWRLDLTHNLMIWDEPMHSLFGLAMGAFHGGYEDFLAKVHPEDSGPIRAAMVRAIETASEYGARYRVIFSDGSIHDLESRGKVHCNERGKPVYLTGVTWDITEQKKAEALERYSEVLKRSNEELERFAYVVSHDLKSPLNNIVSYTQKLLEEADSADENSKHQWLERMYQSAIRMYSLIEGLLDYSRVEAEEKKMEPVDLVELFAQIVADLESHIQRHQGSVEIGVLPAVVGDRLQLRQLFQNLMANGIKFHPKGRGARVSVSGNVLDENTVQIRIKDDGIGIEEEYLTAIFKPFSRLHSQNTYEGSGIGLATCQRIIERHGGSIKIQSRLGEGSTFLVNLPSALSHGTGNTQCAA